MQKNKTKNLNSTISLTKTARNRLQRGKEPTKAKTKKLIRWQYRKAKLNASKQIGSGKNSPKSIMSKIKKAIFIKNFKRNILFNQKIIT